MNDTDRTDETPETPARPLVSPARPPGKTRRKAGKPWREVFLAALYDTRGRACAAARAAGVAHQTAFTARARDPEFASAWDDVITQLAHDVQGIAFGRALDGESDRIIIELLKAWMPERYDRKAVAEVEVKTPPGSVPPLDAHLIGVLAGLASRYPEVLAARPDPED